MTAAPATKGPVKIDHNGGPVPYLEEKWIEGKLEEVHANVCVVSFQREDGSRVSVSINSPLYPCDWTTIEKGSIVLVRAHVQPPSPALAVIQGQSINVKL